MKVAKSVFNFELVPWNVKILTVLLYYVTDCTAYRKANIEFTVLEEMIF